MTTIRSIVFQLAYWVTSIFYVLGALPLMLLPSRRPVMIWILGYTKTMCFWMRWIAGIKITIRGREKVPAGPSIIAAKHQSWEMVSSCIRNSQILRL